MTARQDPIRVLVVDDSRDLADSLAASLSLLGCAVKTATDGESAVACLAAWRPSVAFIDLSMPGLSGFDEP